MRQNLRTVDTSGSGERQLQKIEAEPMKKKRPVAVAEHDRERCPNCQCGKSDTLER